MSPDKPLVSSGNITIRNTDAPTGNGFTPNSTVKVDVGGSYSAASIQVRGTYTGVLSVQVTLDGDLWVTLSSSNSLTNMATGTQSATIASGSQGVWTVNTAGVVGVRVTALAAMTGTAAITLVCGVGDGVVIVGAPTTVSGTITANQGTLLSGTTYNLVTTASNNLANIKSTAGNLFNLTVSNPTATAAYVKLYNKASAPVVASDVPVMTIAIPATAAGVAEKSFDFGAIGKRFATGISIAVTGAAAATDTTNAVAGIQINGTYI